MKYKNKYYILGVLAAGLITSCSDLDTNPEGQLTGTQYGESLEKDPTKLAASVSAINYAIAKEYCVYGITSGRADDFGWPSQCLSEGCNSADITGVVSGYNWFSTPSTYSDRTYNYANPYLRWAMFYNQIKSCNDLLDQIPAETDNVSLKQYKGIAKAKVVDKILERVPDRISEETLRRQVSDILFERDYSKVKETLAEYRRGEIDKQLEQETDPEKRRALQKKKEQAVQNAPIGPKRRYRRRRSG